MKIIWRYLKDYKKECVFAPLFKLLEAAFELFVPLVVAAVIDRGISTGDRPYIYRMFAILVVLSVIGLVCAITAQFYSAKAATGFAAKLRHALFSHIQSLSYADLDSFGTPKLITRISSDVTQMQTGVNLFLRLIMRAPFVVFGAMIMAFAVDVKGALVFCVTIPLLLAVAFGIIVGCLPLYKKVQSHLDAVTTATRENLTGVRVIRAFAKEQQQQEAFAEKNDALYAVQRFTGPHFLSAQSGHVFDYQRGHCRAHLYGCAAGQPGRSDPGRGGRPLQLYGSDSNRADQAGQLSRHHDPCGRLDQPGQGGVRR